MAALGREAPKRLVRLVVFGGTGFVGSAIAEEAVRRGLSVTCLTRGGRPPARIAAQAWSDKV
jgi:uncharacterized protein YbjT (DUF2867 family)